MIIDGLLFPVGLRPLHGEIAFHNFGAALWSEAMVRPAFEVGVITPSAVIEEITATAVGQLAFAFGIGDRVSLGFGYRMVERASMERFEISVVDGLAKGDKRLCIGCGKCRAIQCPRLRREGRGGDGRHRRVPGGDRRRGRARRREDRRALFAAGNRRGQAPRNAKGIMGN